MERLPLRLFTRKGKGCAKVFFQNKIFNVVRIRLRVANLICSPQT